MDFLVHSYTCCTDRHASPYWMFIRRWISMGFTASLLKERTTDAVLLWCMLQAGPPYLHYYCAVVLHFCILLPHVGHFSNHEYHCRQFTRQSSCVSIFIKLFRFTFDSPCTYCFPLRQWLHKHDSMLRYTYITCLLVTGFCTMEKHMREWLKEDIRREGNGHVQTDSE